MCWSWRRSLPALLARAKIRHKKTPLGVFPSPQSCCRQRFAFGAQWSHDSHAANANFSRQAGASALPGRGNSYNFPLCLEGSRRRIRLLSVHSHSHGGSVISAVKRGARKSPGAVFALVCGFAGVFCRVCRLHGAVFLPFSGILSPESMFLPSYQNSFVFSSENQQNCTVCTAFSRFPVKSDCYRIPSIPKVNWPIESHKINCSVK